MKRRLEASLANQAQSPGAVFGERLRRSTPWITTPRGRCGWKTSPRSTPRRCGQFYADRFSNAANFTFFFVGNFTVDEITPLLADLSRLAAVEGRARLARHRRAPAVSGHRAARDRDQGAEPRAQTVITFFSDTGLDEAQTARVRAAADIVENKLRDILREQLGGTYSVSVSAIPIRRRSPATAPRRCSSAARPRMSRSSAPPCSTEVERLRRDGPTASDLQIVKEADKNDLVQALRQNAYWLNALQSAHVLGRDPALIPRRAERTDALTPENVHEAMRKYLPSDRYTVVTLLPEAPARGRSSR